MASELKKRAIQGIAWGSLGQIANQAGRFVTGIVLARLLSPEDFGLIGMLLIFTSLAEKVINGGFSQALIQKKEIDQSDKTSVFFVNLAAGIGCAVVLYLCAPLISDFYGREELVDLTRLIALTLPLRALSAVHSALMTRAFAFKLQLKLSLLAALCSGTVAIYLAFAGYGVFSLAIQIIAYDISLAVGSWIGNKWRPSLSFQLSSVRVLYQFGSKIFAASLLNAFFGEIHALLIGKLYPAAQLGYYTRARQLTNFPINSLCAVISKVSLPVLARVQDDPRKMKSISSQALSSTAFVSFNAMAAMAFMAEPLIKVLLTEKWLPAVLLLQLMCLGGALYPLHMIHLSIVSAIGRSDLFLKLELVKRVLLSVAILATVKFGVASLVLGSSIVSLIAYFLHNQTTSKLIDYSVRTQIWDIFPALGSALALALSLLTIQNTTNLPPLPLLAAQSLVALAIFSLCAVLFKTSLSTELQGWWSRRHQRT